MRAATLTPVGSAGACLARLPVDGGLPRSAGGSAPTSDTFEACSVFARAAARMARWPPRGAPFPEVLQTIRHLLIRPGCFRLERELPGGTCTHGTSAPSQGTQLNGVEPLAWLTDVLERVVSGRTKAHELERLLPWTWKATRPANTSDI